MQTEAALTPFVDALIEAACPIAIVLGELARAPGRPDPEEARAVLSVLLEEVLEPLGAILAARDLRTTTAILEAAVPLLMENVLALAPSPPPRPRRGHRAQVRSRPRRMRDQR